MVVTITALTITDITNLGYNNTGYNDHGYTKLTSADILVPIDSFTTQTFKITTNNERIMLAQSIFVITEFEYSSTAFDGFFNTVTSNNGYLYNRNHSYKNLEKAG